VGVARTLAARGLAAEFSNSATHAQWQHCAARSALSGQRQKQPVFLNFKEQDDVCGGY